MRALLIAILGLPVTGCRPAAVPPPPSVPAGTLALEQTSRAEHDGDPGAAELTFTAADGTVTRRTLAGTWRILAHSRPAHAFVLGGQFQVGAWLPLDDIRYLDDRTGAIVESHLNDGRWMAMAATASPDGRYLAMVGQRRASDDGVGAFELELLDTTTDRLVTVGAAPAPPPDELYCSMVDEAYTWGDPIDGLVELEDGIVTFADGELRASYGDDTCTARGQPRVTRRWKLVRP